VIPKAAKGVKPAVLFQALMNLDKHRVEVDGSERIEAVAELISTGSLLHAPQGLGVILALGVLQGTVIVQK
jgi:hypothetical protein